MASKFLRRANIFRIAIIALGAIIATRAVFEGLGNEGAENSVVLLIFTFLAISVAIVGGVDSGFKFRENAVEINMLKAKCSEAVYEYEQKWAKQVEQKGGGSREALDNTYTLIDELVNIITDIEQRMAQLGQSISATDVNLLTPKSIEKKRKGAGGLAGARVLVPLTCIILKEENGFSSLCPELQLTTKVAKTPSKAKKLLLEQISANLQHTLEEGQPFRSNSKESRSVLQIPADRVEATFHYQVEAQASESLD